MKKSFVVTTLVLVGLGCFMAGWLLRPAAQHRQPLPVLGTVPDYTLTDQLGRPVASTAFAGKVRVVTFLFPYCTSYCPLIAHNFVSLAGVLQTAGLDAKVQLVSFNVDPENTGIDQMRTFQRQYGWNPEDPRWAYLTGKPEQIRHIVRDAFHIYYKKVRTGHDEGEEGEGTHIPELVVGNRLAEQAQVGYDIVHNDALVIVDTQGRIRKYFSEADRISDDQLIEVIRQLLGEAAAVR